MSKQEALQPTIHPGIASEVLDGEHTPFNPSGKSGAITFGEQGLVFYSTGGNPYLNVVSLPPRIVEGIPEVRDVHGATQIVDNANGRVIWRNAQGDCIKANRTGETIFQRGTK